MFWHKTSIYIIPDLYLADNSVDETFSSKLNYNTWSTSFATAGVVIMQVAFDASKRFFISLAVSEVVPGLIIVSKLKTKIWDIMVQY